MGGGPRKHFFSIKTYNHPRNPENKCPGPQNDCPGLKIDPQAFKITAHLGVETPRRSPPRAQRNGTVPGYARSALDIILHIYIYFLKMFHIFSLVCFLIYGVNRKQILIAKQRFYFLFFRFCAFYTCLLYTSPSPRDQRGSRMPSSA